MKGNKQKRRYPAGTLDLVQIQDAIYDWINSVTQGVIEEPIQIAWRNQSEPMPPRPCVTLKFTYGPAPIARDASVRRTAKGELIVGMQQEATLSIQVFGNSQVHRPMAYQLAVDLNSSLMRQSIKDDLKRGGVSIQELGKPQNMTALEESEYEERAGFELSLGMVQNILDDPGTIKTVNLSQTADGTKKIKTIILP